MEDILENTTVENTTVENTTVENTTVENTTVENTTVENTTVENTTQSYTLTERRVEQCLVAGDENRISLVLSGKPFIGFNKNGDTQLTNIISIDTLNLSKMIGEKSELLNLASALACGKHLEQSFVSICVTNAIIDVSREFHQAEEEREYGGVYANNCFVSKITKFQPRVSKIFENAALQMIQQGSYIKSDRNKISLFD